MSMPASWDRHARLLAARADRTAYHRKVLESTGERHRAGGLCEVVSLLALPWMGLCIPHGHDPHVGVAEAYDRGQITLGEAVGHLMQWAEEVP